MQNGVSIETYDSALNIIYGMVNIRPEREQARSSVRYILTDLNDIRKNYMFLGFHLRECLKNKYYEDFGFTTMEEFCEKNFGMDKTALSRCINVVEEFSMKEHYVNGIKKGEFMLEVDDQWKEFSYSQLVEMLPLSEEQRYKIKPTMSIKEIREYKKSLKKELKDTEGEKVAMSQQLKLSSRDEIYMLHGKERRELIKSLDGELCHIAIFNPDGKLYKNCEFMAHMLLKDGDTYYFKLYPNVIVPQEE